LREALRINERPGNHGAVRGDPGDAGKIDVSVALARGTVMTMVKTDMPPSARRNTASEIEA
jgi:hypothetical protein